MTLTTTIQPHEQGKPEGALLVLSVLEESTGRGMGTKQLLYKVNQSRPLSMYKLRKALTWLEGRAEIEDRSYQSNRASWAFITPERRAEILAMQAKRAEERGLVERLEAHGIAAKVMHGRVCINARGIETVLAVLDATGRLDAV